jgi:hypothetical protein
MTGSECSIRRIIAVVGLLGILLTTGSARTLRLQLGAKSAFFPAGYRGVNDAYIDSVATDRNFGGDWEYPIGGLGNGAVRRGLMRWDLSAVAPLFSNPRYEVIGVELKIGLWYQWKIYDQPFDLYQILPANAGWVEGTRKDDPGPGLVTWGALANAQRGWAGSAGCGTPGKDYAPVPLASFLPDTVTHMLPRYLRPIDLPVDLVRSWALTPKENAGLLIRRRDETADQGEQYVFFISSQHMRTDHGWHLHHPELTINYIDRSNFGESRPGELVSAGRTGHIVVIPDDPQGSIRYAATELVDHIRDLTGCELTVVREGKYRPALGHPVSIGRTQMSRRAVSDRAFRKLGDEGFIVKTDGQALTILGGDRRGNLYGVYAFLEGLGIRWLTPKVALLPKRSSIPSPRKKIRFVPPVFYRDQLWNNGSDPAWRSRMRLNGEFARLPQHMGGSARVHLSCHSYHALVAATEFGEHPDWFALKTNGQRRAGNARTVELCTTNPELRRHILARVRRDLRANPAIEQYWVSQDDGLSSGCFCERCTAERLRHGGKRIAEDAPLPTDPVGVGARLKDHRWAANTISLANTIARGIRDEFPRVQIKTLAYSYTWPAPDLKVEPNVVVVICGPAGDWFLPYEDNEKTRDWRRSLRAWTRLGGKVQTYMYGGSNYGYWWPFPTWFTMCRNHRTAYKDGVRAMYRQGTHAGYGAEFTELRAYLSARMAYDPKRDIMTEVTEFTDAYYGPGAVPIREYMVWFDNYLNENQIHGHHYWGNSRGWAEYMTPELVTRADEFLQEALDRTQGHPEYHRRVRAARLPLLLMKVLLGVRDTPLLTESEMILVDETQRGDLTAAARRFGETMQDWGYNRWNEHTGYAPERNPLTAYARRHPILRLRNAAAQVAIVPSLGGRIVRWDVTALGRNIVHLPDSRVENYPYGGGYEEYSQFERTSPGPAAEFAAQQPSTPRRVVLRARLRNGIELDRTFELAPTGSRLTIRSAFTNRGTAPIRVTPRSHPEFDIGCFRRATLDYTDATGEHIRRELLTARRPRGEVSLPVASVSGNSWRLVDKATGCVIENRFERPEITTLYCFYGEAQGCVNLELWGKATDLAPGASVSLTQTFAVTKADSSE